MSVFGHLALGWIALITACGGRSRDPSSTPLRVSTTFDTLESGSVVAVNRGYRPDAAPAYRLVERLRIGSLDGPDDAFGRPRDFIIASNGDVWVLDGLSEEIRIFDASGRFLRRIGGRGRGPRELLGATGMEPGPGDTVWVPQVANQRYTLYTADGVFVGTRERRYPRGPRELLRFDTAGYLWDGYQAFAAPSVFDAVVVRRTPPGSDSATGPADSLRLPMGSPEGRRPSSELRLFVFGDHHRSAFVTSPRGTLWTWVGRPLTLLEFDVHGREVRRAVIADLPPPRDETAEEVEVWKEAKLEQLGRIGMAGQSGIHWIDKGTHPQATWIQVDDRGRPWAFGEPERPGGPPVIRLFSPEGVYLGDVAADFSFQPTRVRVEGSTFVALGEGRRGEPQVIVASIESATGEGG